MIPAVEEKTDDLKRLCIHHGVQQLNLFGSASTDRYDSGKSDLDFVVEFRPEALLTFADTYFGLLESLDGLFEQPVDLVVGSAIRNPYFLQSVEKTRTPVYASLS